MHFGKISLVCFGAVTFVAAEQLVHDPNVGKGKTPSPATSTMASHPARLQMGKVLHGLQHQQRKQKNLQQNSQSLDHDHLNRMAQAIANGVQRPNLAQLLQQGTAAVGSLKSEAQEGLHNLWDEVSDHYHALSNNVKGKLPIVRADLKKMAPYAVPVAEIMTALLARDIELEEEIYARGLDWYMDDDE